MSRVASAAAPSVSVPSEMDVPSELEEGALTLQPRPVAERGSRHVRRAVVASVVGVLALSGVVIAFSDVGAGTQQSASAASGAGVVGLGLLSALTSAGSFAQTAASLVKNGQSGYTESKELYGQLSAPEQQAFKDIAQEPAAVNLTDAFKGKHGFDLYPQGKMHDGNSCPDGDEFHAGLCYARCVDLTNGKYPIRTTAFACCQSEPCSFFNTKFSMPWKLCNGMNVAGSPAPKFASSTKVVQETYCPHQPGDCLSNEEFNLGMCYMKCNLLTNDEYPYRFGANTCCKYKSHMACFDPVNVLTSMEHNVGGGKGDKLLENSFGAVHAPVPGLAEYQTTVAPVQLPQ